MTLPTFTWWNGTTASPGYSHEAQHVCRKERMKIPATLLRVLRLTDRRDHRHQPSASTIGINHRHQPSASTIGINHRHQPSASTIGMIVVGVTRQVLTWLQ